MRNRNRLERRHNPRLTAEVHRQGRRITWVAAQLGVSQWTFWRYETGRAAPPLDWYARAAEVLGVREEDVRPDVLAA